MARTGPSRCAAQVPNATMNTISAATDGGPERADLGSRRCRASASGSSRRRIHHRVAGLGEGEDAHEDGEDRVHHQPADLAQVGRDLALRPSARRDGRRTSATTPARQPTIHQSAMPDPVRAISAPTIRLAARKPMEPRPRDWRVGEAPGARRGHAQRLGDRADAGHGGADRQGGERAAPAAGAIPRCARKSTSVSERADASVAGGASSRSASAGIARPATTRTPMPSAV